MRRKIQWGLVALEVGAVIVAGLFIACLAWINGVI